MPPSPTADLARWKADQARVWGAGSWEALADTVLAAAHDELVARLAPQPGERWLDVATGTGAVALRAARAGARVTGLDLAPALIRTAEARAGEQGLAIHFEVGDAERLPYPDAGFDVVSSAHGVVFAADHLAAAVELARVCRPGGRLGLTYSLPKPELAQLMERIGHTRPVGAGSPRNWADRDYVRGLLGAAFDLSFSEGVCHWKAESGEVSWQLFVGSDGPAKTSVEAMPTDEREAVRRDWIAYFERHRQGDGVDVPRPYVVITGVRRDGEAQERQTIHGLLREARARLDRLSPQAAHAAMSDGALLIDIRSESQRAAGGVIGGGLFIARNVLEWRLDPASGHQHPSVGGLDRQVVLMCNEGYQSSLAAATLQTLGFDQATDVIGGFQAWREAGLPVEPPPR